MLKFIEDAGISGEMVWQSYPVIWIVLGWLATGTLTLAALVALEKSAFGRARVAVSAWSAAGGFAIMFVLTLLGLLGRVSNINIENPTPQRWSDAFFSSNEAVGALGLNPAIFLYDTLKVPHDPTTRCWWRSSIR
ncbi:MAG TPA: hypothetical protein VMP00_05345 [Burkholderiales bacterium]|nr:hypothetical protein [Burkholderiales bacterium]